MDLTEDQIRNGVILTEPTVLPEVDDAESELKQQLANDRSGRVDDPVPDVEWNPADIPTDLNPGPHGSLPHPPDEAENPG